MCVPATSYVPVRHQPRRSTGLTHQPPSRKSHRHAIPHPPFHSFTFALSTYHAKRTTVSRAFASMPALSICASPVRSYYFIALPQRRQTDTHSFTSMYSSSSHRSSCVSQSITLMWFTFILRSWMGNSTDSHAMAWGLLRRSHPTIA